MGLFSRDKDQSVVDLRQQAAAPKLEFGLPTRCPACNEPGYLDSIDLTVRRMYQHCPACFTKWVTSEDELTSA
jgi:hypothetical protein